VTRQEVTSAYEHLK